MREKMHAMVSETQSRICEALERLDGGRFRRDAWQRAEGGGGLTAVLEDSAFFEKAGVNVSAVHGPFPEEAARAARGRGAKVPAGPARFYATGISLVLHPRNPHAPTVHANYRYFEAAAADGSGGSFWFGGGADLTPSYLYEEDARHFHGTLKAACDRHDPAYYPRFKKWCDDYFRIVHRGECRGLGGIFFDDLCDRDPERLFAFVSDAASSFLPAVLPVYERRAGTPFDAAQKRWQELRRGRYVEFNLVYDRGTSFGLRTGGRIESILMSLPLVARWEYDRQPERGSEEARLLELLKHPVDWV